MCLKGPRDTGDGVCLSGCLFQLALSRLRPRKQRGIRGQRGQLQPELLWLLPEEQEEEQEEQEEQEEEQEEPLFPSATRRLSRASLQQGTNGGGGRQQQETPTSPERPRGRKHYWVCMHTCHHPDCLNPYHLAWGSHIDNLNASPPPKRKRGGRP